MRACVTPPARPSALRAAALLLVIVRSLSVPVFSVITPPVIVEAVDEPVRPSIFASRPVTSLSTLIVVRIVADRVRRHEGQRLAVDGEGVTDREAVRQRSRRAVADAQLGGAGQSTSRHGATATSAKLWYAC